MFTTNPWVAYVSIVGPLLAGYYLLVGFIFYRHNLKARITNWKSPPIGASGKYFKTNNVEDGYFQEPDSLNSKELTPNTDNGYEGGSEASWENEGMMQQLEEVSIHLKQAIQEAHEKQYSKQEFILLAQMTLKEYPAIYGTPFQLSINHLIEAECSKYGSIHLDSEDRKRMWNQVD